MDLKPITGAEVTLTDGSHLALLCETPKGTRTFAVSSRELPADQVFPFDRLAIGLAVVALLDAGTVGAVEEVKPDVFGFGRRRTGIEMRPKLTEPLQIGLGMSAPTSGLAGSR
jgi:hypothetical protein